MAVNIHPQRGEAVVEKVIAKKSSVITPEDELAVVVMEIDDAQDDFEEGEDRGPGMAERRLEKWLALLASCPMDVILSKYKADIEDEIAGTKVTHQLDVKEHLARLCAVVLLAQERCSQG